MFLHHKQESSKPVAVAGNVEPLDVSAAWTADHKALTVAIVNPTEKEQQVAIDLKGARLGATGKLWLIAHSDPMAYNEPGKEPNVVIEERPVTGVSGRLSSPPLSVSLYKLRAGK